MSTARGSGSDRSGWPPAGSGAPWAWSERCEPTWRSAGPTRISWPIWGPPALAAPPWHEIWRGPPPGSTPTPSDPDRDIRLVALEVRHLVENGCLEVLTHVGRAGGAAPLCHDPAQARRAADLQVYVRQYHAERDDEALGRLPNRWTASAVTTAQQTPDLDQTGTPEAAWADWHLERLPELHSAITVGQCSSRPTPTTRCWRQAASCNGSRVAGPT